MRRLPPPPWLCAERVELATLKEALEDHEEREAVLRKQMGAMVFEKGSLNYQLVRLTQRLDEAAEEKARAVHALGEALSRATDERDMRQGGVGEPMLQQMVASQKRTIEGLRRELRTAQDMLSQNQQIAQHTRIAQHQQDKQPCPPQTPQTPLPPSHHPPNSPPSTYRQETNEETPTQECGAPSSHDLEDRLSPYGLPADRPLKRHNTDGEMLSKLPSRRTRESELTHEQLTLSLLHLQTDHSSMALQLSRVQKDKEKAHAEAADLKEKIQDLEREVGRLTREVEALTARLQEQLVQLESTRAKLANANSALPQVRGSAPRAAGVAHESRSLGASDQVSLDVCGEATSSSSAIGSGAFVSRHHPPQLRGRIWRVPLRWALWALGAGGMSGGAQAGRLQQRLRSRRELGKADQHALMSV